MPIEQVAVDAAFNSDIARDADYVKASGQVLKVRVIASTPDIRRDLGGIEVLGKQRLFDVRVSEISDPTAGDRLTPYVEGPNGAWAPGPEILVVAKRPDRADRCGLVWTLDVVKQ